MKNTILLPHGHLPNPILKVGIDVDNTLLHNDILWSHYFHHGPCLAETPHRHVPLGEASLSYDHYKKLCRPCFDHVVTAPEIVGEHAIVAGAADAIRDLHARGVRFHVITARPESNYDLTVEWLYRNGIAQHAASVTFAWEKLETVESLDLDFIVDDNPSVFAELANHPCRVIMPDMPYNREIEPDFRVRDWQEVYRTLFAQIRERAQA